VQIFGGDDDDDDDDDVSGGSPLSSHETQQLH
jgi:hypothetical protein